jgi:hypothetical protein
MNAKYFSNLALSSLLFFTLLGCNVKVNSSANEVSSDEFLEILSESYAFGYPLLLMDLTKNVSTSIESPHETKPFAPINQLGHFRKFPDYKSKTIVKPNVDTYYSIVWFDLSKGPQVLTMPATERYYLLPFYDAYTNVFASPGTRTNGTEALTLLIAGPNWKGETPEGMTLVQSPTNLVWLLGRIQGNSEKDLVLRDIQNNMALVPLKEYGNSNYSQPKGITKDLSGIIPVKEIQKYTAVEFINKMTKLMAENPPDLADSAFVVKMAKIGIEAGKEFSFTTNNFILKEKIKRMPVLIHDKMEARRAQPDTSLLQNGWMMVTKDIGTYGTDYFLRAYIDFIGFGANLPEDSVYPNCTLDSDKNPLEASKNYVLRFKANEIPPVNAFWSLTAYNDSEFLVENEINRYALGSRDSLVYNEDGSLDIYVQHKKPAKNLSNWLPIPVKGTFYLTMRLYWPKKEVLNGGWQLPLIKHVK